MHRCTIFAAFLALFALAAAGCTTAQSVSVCTRPPGPGGCPLAANASAFLCQGRPGRNMAPLITVDDAQRFQEIDGFGASLTDSAAWLFTTRLSRCRPTLLQNPVQPQERHCPEFSAPAPSAPLTWRSPSTPSTTSASKRRRPAPARQRGRLRASPTTRFSTTSKPILPLLKKALALNSFPPHHAHPVGARPDG